MSSAGNDNRPDMAGKAKEDFNRAAQGRRETDKPSPELDREPPKHQLRAGAEFDRTERLRATRENTRGTARQRGLSLG